MKYLDEDEPEDTYGADDDQTSDPDVSSGDAGNDTEGTEDDS